MLIKATHFLYIHHEHSSILWSNQLGFTQDHHQCPICAFKALDEIKTKALTTINKPKPALSYLPLPNYRIDDTFVLFPFNPRAPPVYRIF